MVHVGKEYHGEAAKICASKGGRIVKEVKSEIAALAKEKGCKDIWTGELEQLKIMIKRSFVCEAMCNEGKLLNCWMIIEYREYY